jgi:tetratricopeptide (TPR) repeat protein
MGNKLPFLFAIFSFLLLPITAFSHEMAWEDTLPINLKAHFGKTLAYFRNTPELNGFKDVTEYSKINQREAAFYLNRGAYFYHQGAYDRAISEYDKALKVSPGFVRAYSNRGVAYVQKGLFDEAVKDLSKALELNPNDTLALTNRGAVYVQKGLFDEAIGDLTKSLEINHNDASALNNRGAALLRKGFYQKAVQDLTNALRINAKDVNAFYNRGFAHYLMGNDDQAIDDLTRALELGALNKADIYRIRGMAWHQKDENTKAKSDYQAAIALNPDDEEIRKHLDAIMKAATQPINRLRPNNRVEIYDLQVLETMKKVMWYIRTGVSCSKHYRLLSLVQDVLAKKSSYNAVNTCLYEKAQAFYSAINMAHFAYSDYENLQSQYGKKTIVYNDHNAFDSITEAENTLLYYWHEADDYFNQAQDCLN